MGKGIDNDRCVKMVIINDNYNEYGLVEGDVCTISYFNTELVFVKELKRYIPESNFISVELYRNIKIYEILK